jgi:hypothetical protein
VEYLTRYNNWRSEKKLTSPTDIKGHHVAASKENPETSLRARRQAKRRLTSLIL